MIYVTVFRFKSIPTQYLYTDVYFLLLIILVDILSTSLSIHFFSFFSGSNCVGSKTSTFQFLFNIVKTLIMNLKSVYVVT